MSKLTKHKSKLHILIEEVGVVAVLKNVEGEAAGISLVDRQVDDSVKDVVADIV